MELSERFIVSIIPWIYCVLNNSSIVFGVLQKNIFFQTTEATMQKYFLFIKRVLSIPNK